VASITLVYAQTKTATGTIVSMDDGQPIIGAMVKVKGTKLGAVSGANGEFRIKVPSEASTLVITYIGMDPKEVEALNDQIIKLESKSEAINEVVVTALGISREKKSLGYAVQEIKSDELTKSRGGVSNPVNALVGKVAGLQITGASGNMGGSSKILLRGSKSITGNNQPLFVIDGVPIEGSDFNSADAARGAGGYDYGNLIQDINPDDIESISVLKGPNASALYGSRASNGVVMIVTKKGAKGAGVGVSFNSGIGFEVVSKLPVMQNQYGGGYGLYPEEINGKTFNTIDYNIDESWGPAYDGTTQYLSWYDLAKWEDGGKVGDPTTSTWQAPTNDIKSFFETGMSMTNNVNISQASENASFRVSYTNTALKGYMPNSHLGKNVFNLSGSAKVAKIYEVFSNITYLNQAATGRAETGYGDNNVMQKFIQWGQRQLDMKELKAMYKYSDGTQAGWNRNAFDDPTMAYSNNPYWSRYMNYQNDTRQRLYGNAGVKASILENLSAQFKTSLDFFSDKRYARNAVYSQEESSYEESQRQQYEVNHEFMAQYSDKFEDMSLNVNAGANLMYRNYQSLSGFSVSGLVIPEFYNLSNSKSPAKAENFLNEKGVNSVFANATFGKKSLIYIDGTFRVDQSSTLPAGKNIYSYYSGTGSIILSEIIKKDWLSFSKARISFAKVGGDTDPYRTYDTYQFYTSFNTDHAYQLPLVKNNANLKPEQTYSTEFGLESNFLNDRIGFDLTLYKSTTVDQITNISLSGASGYTSQILNAGTMENKGVEFKLNATPFRTNDFEWTVTLTAAKNSNRVKELVGDLKYLKIASAPFKVEVGAYVGQEYGVIMGTDYVYDANGNKVVGDDGLYESTSGNTPLGSVNPSITGGILNSFRYKNFNCSILFDGQAGGKFFSTSNMWGIYSGMLDETAGTNELGNLKRNDPAEGGGILLEGVLEDGTPNTQRLDAETWASGYYSGPAAQNVFKSDFIKLREFTIGYTVPLRSKVINTLKVSAYGRNLALWGPDTKHFDPESATTSSGNVQGIEGGALPSVTSFGLNFGLQF